MGEIKGIARAKFHPGKVEAWKRLTAEAMEIVRTRSGGSSLRAARSFFSTWIVMEEELAGAK